jgi:hypothetical protein
MLFAEQAAEKEKTIPAWSRNVGASVLRAANAEKMSPEDERNVDQYGESVRQVSEFYARVSSDLRALRESWAKETVGTGVAGAQRLTIFDRCVASPCVRTLPPSREELAREPRICAFTGMPTCDWSIFEFGHEKTDRVPPIRAVVDQCAFDTLLRFVILYAHFVPHMAQHTHLYEGYTEEQRVHQYAWELAATRTVIQGMTRYE